MTVHLFHSLLPVPAGIPQVAALALDATPVEFSLIIPTYNERENLPQLLAELVALLESVVPGDYEIIVVDDNSPDRTWELALDLMSQYPQLWVMRRQREQGLASAVVRGWQVSRGKILGVIDADLQHPPQTLLPLLQQIQGGADLAIASRHIEGGGVSNWSFSRRFLSRGAQILGLILLPGVVGRVSDPMSGFFLVRRGAIAHSPLYPHSYKILLEVLARGQAGAIAEVGYIFRSRHQGQSKVSLRQYSDYLLHLLRLRLSLFPGQRFLRFGLVGLSGVCVDMALFYGLSSTAGLGWGLSLSKILAAEAAMVNNFIWNDAWTFRDLSSHQRGWRKRGQRFLKFNLVCGLGLVLNVLILNLLVHTILPHKYLANLVAIALTTVWNFWINFKLSWRVTDTH